MICVDQGNPVRDLLTSPTRAIGCVGQMLLVRCVFRVVPKANDERGEGREKISVS